MSEGRPHFFFMETDAEVTKLREELAKLREELAVVRQKIGLYDEEPGDSGYVHLDAEGHERCSCDCQKRGLTPLLSQKVSKTPLLTSKTAGFLSGNCPNEKVSSKNPPCAAAVQSWPLSPIALVRSRSGDFS
jgi:hypothetical protein